MNYNSKISFKAILSLLAVVLFTVQLSSQAMVKGSGIRYYQGYTLATYPSATAPETTYGTEIAFFIDLNIFCKWDRVTSVWVPVDNILVQSGAPTHTPGVGDPVSYLDKDTGDLYKYNAGLPGWELSGAKTTVTKITTVADTTTITGPLDGDIFVNALGDTTGFYDTDRWQIATAKKSVSANTLYVDPNGDNSTAQKGRIDLPWADLETPSDNALPGKNTFIVNPGIYEQSTGFSATVADSNIYNISDTAHFEVLGQTEIKFSNTTSNFFYGFSDVATAFGDSRAKDFSYHGPNSTISADRTGFTSSLLLPFSFYHLNSNVDINVGKIVGTNGRVWGIQSGTPNTTVKVKEYESTGGIAFSISTTMDDDGEIQGFATRKVKAEFGTIKAGLQNDTGGAIRMQSATKDSGSVINVVVDNFILHPDVAPFRLEYADSSKNNVLDFDFGTFTKENTGSSVAQEGYLPGSANNGAVFIQRTCKDTCYTRVGFKKWRQNAAPIIANFIDDGSQRNFYNSTVILDFGQLKIDTGTVFMLDRWGLYQGSKLIIKCEDCTNEGSPFFSIFNNTIDSTSGIYIEGNFTVNAAKPLIETRTSRVFLKGNFSNDGTVPAITTDSTATVYVSGAFNTNTIILDPDVTIVRLPEYGASASGAGGNGIFDAANDGGVLPVAAYTVNLFATTGQLQLLGSATGTAQSRLLLNSSTAAGGTILEDRNPASPANAANLTLNWDGTSTLTTDNQSFTIGTGTAAIELSGAEVKLNGYAGGTVTGTPAYNVKMESDGTLITTTLAKAFMSVSGGSTTFIAGTPEKIDGDTPGTTTDVASSSDMTVASSRVTYTGTETKTFQVTAIISSDTGSASEMTYFVAKNGATVGTGKARDHSNSDIGNLSVQWVVTLATNDYVEIYVDAVDNETVNVNSYNITVVEW